MKIVPSPKKYRNRPILPTLLEIWHQHKKDDLLRVYMDAIAMNGQIQVGLFMMTGRLIVKSASNNRSKKYNGLE